MPNNSNQLPNDSLFKNLNNIRTSSKHLDALSFYKLLITLSNLHSTVSTFYETVNEKSLSLNISSKSLLSKIKTLSSLIVVNYLIF